ncbi:MAG: hypothetical protein CVU39_25840 [Chloroflexi bacterium HGW-Chloroflexi-10]|nr:MAG: hypothetical protein CVU39_25840 [Chloroflexi bacterium HGW-Chloroflexi-10]
MLKLKISLCLLFMITCVWSGIPVQAQGIVDGYQTYFPVISNSPTVEESWIGPEGGFVVCIVAHPTNADIIYAGSWGAGVLKSIDGGLTWRKKNVGLGNLFINSFAIDPQNPRIMYAGTYKDKIYKSTDSGETWYQSSAGIQYLAIVYAIAIDPHNPDIIYAATRGENNTSAPPWKGIVYRSENEGINWSPVIENVGGSNQQDWAYDLIVNPKSHNIVFAAMHEYGIYRSTNTGDSFQAVNSGLNDLSTRALSINPVGTGSDALYMGTWHNSGTYKSTDNGNSWSRTAMVLKVYNMDLDNVSPSTLYLANYPGGVYKSTNGGESWSLKALADHLMYTVAVNQARHNQVFVGTIGDGIFRSDDGGSNWTFSQQGLHNTNVTAVIAKKGDPQVLFASTSGGGASFSYDGGKTWVVQQNNLVDLNMTYLVINPANDNQLIGLTSSGGVVRCAIDSCGWSTQNSGLPMSAAKSQIEQISALQPDLGYELTLSGVADTEESSNDQLTAFQSLRQIVFAPSNPNRVYLATGGSGVYISNNNGLSWASAGLSDKSIGSVAVHPLNENILYATTGESGVVKYSENGGSSWRDTSMPNNLSTQALSISVLEPERIFAGTSNGVYTRLGNGAWEYLGLDGIYISKIAAHPTRSDVLITGTMNGVYYSLNGGNSWMVGPTELFGKQISSIGFDPNNAFVAYIGTTTFGALRMAVR